MKMEIVSESDDNFKINVKQFGEVFVATDGDRVVIGTTEEIAVVEVEEQQQLAQKVKLAAPIENPKGLDWFAGTSWGNK